MYNQFINRVKLSATIKARTGLYIGAGQGSYSPLETQCPVVKTKQGYPYIPGSSLKGVLRSFLESVQCNIDNVILSQNCVSCNNSLAKKEDREAWVKRYGSEDADGGTKRLAMYIEQGSCPACRLFGSPIMAGKLKFADATLKNQKKETEKRMGNAIDRDTHTAVSGALFETEVIPTGTEFSLLVIAENLTKEEAEIFSELMEYFADGGITIGGRARAGLGIISVKDFVTEVFCTSETGFRPKRKYCCPGLDVSKMTEFLPGKEDENVQEAI